MLAAAAAAGAAGTAQAQALEDIPLIETTLHLYDPSRPQGAPYAPDPGGMSPAKYRTKMVPGVVGVVVCECSPWIEDNLWLLEECAKDPLMVGVIGNLRPTDADFPQYVERFAKNPLFRAIRYGNIWGYDLTKQSRDANFLAGLKTLADADLVLDVCNPTLDLLQTVVRINDQVPNLRIVVDHLGGFYPTADEQPAVKAVLAEYAHRPAIYGKITAFGMGLGDKAPPMTLAANRDRVQPFFDAFGEERVIGGTWSAQSMPMYRDWFAGRRSAAEKFFWKNSARAYKWKPRAANQPRLA
jgi:predicted TIM-barrel fold metal-dependent hydrolase